MTLAADHLHELSGWFRELPNDILERQSGEDFAVLLGAMLSVSAGYESEDPGYSR